MKTDLAHFCDKLLWRYKLAWKSMNVTKFSDKGIFPNIVMCHQIQSEIVIFYLLFTHVRTWLKWILVFIQKKIRTFSHTTNIGRKTIATCYFYIFFFGFDRSLHLDRDKIQTIYWSRFVQMNNKGQHFGSKVSIRRRKRERIIGKRPSVCTYCSESWFSGCHFCCCLIYLNLEIIRLEWFN